MRSLTLAFCFTACSIANLADADAPAWPNWMGPHHDGISTEANWSTDWPDDGLKVDWQKEVGIGFSSVAIADNQLFTLGHAEGMETVFCFHALTGEEIWSHSYPSKLVANLYEGGPGSTPTIDGEHVLTVGKEGQLFCFRRSDGQVVWQRQLKDDLDVRLPEWGFNSSPFILGDQLILEAGRVVSYAKTTGDILWKSSKHPAGYGSAALFPSGDAPMIVTLDCDAVRVLQADDGSEVDSFPWPSPFRTNSTTPIVHEDSIFVSTGYQVGCGLFRLVDRKLELIYDNREMRNHFNNSILHQGHLYGFDGNSNLGRVVSLVCMNHETGEVAWRHRGLGCGSLMIAGDRLVLLSEDGQLVIATATPDDFRELARAKILEGRCWTIPVLLNGHVYARNAQGNLVSVSLPPAKPIAK
ncbi:MAG: PQQ-binding-like beta-propeller repeat protein [Rubripirellula sp.]